MRVLFDMLRDGLPLINKAADELAAAQQQVASGRRLQTISDDPQAARLAVTERAQLGTLDAYTRTTSSATERLAAVDSTLSSIVDKLSAAIVAGTAGKGSQTTAASRAALAADVRGLRDSLVSDFNASYGGVYLFAGTSSTQPAYVQSGGTWNYQGNAETQQVEIARGRTVGVTLNGQTIAQGSDPNDVFAVLENLALAIESGSSTAVQTELDALDRAFDRALRAQGSLGADERAVYDASARAADLKLAAEARRSSLEDANMAEAVTRMQQADTAYRAALGAVSTAERLSLLDYLR